MDLEHLNKTQIILLALLVSFVTSIATGIVTVSLMNQAPPEVAATVNHVIEHTIQQIVPQQVAGPTTVKTVIVKDDDAATRSIAAVQKSIIRIVASSSPDLLIARGLIIDKQGTAMTDNGSVDSDVLYEAILSDGTRVPVVIRAGAATTSSIALLDLKIGSTTTLAPATIVDSTKLQLGQTIIRIGGVGADNVAEGVIAALPQSSSADAPQTIEATVSSQTPGSVLIDLYGDVIGMVTTDSATLGVNFYSVPKVATLADAPVAPNASQGAGSIRTETNK